MCKGKECCYTWSCHRLGCFVNTENILSLLQQLVHDFTSCAIPFLLCVDFLVVNGQGKNLSRENLAGRPTSAPQWPFWSWRPQYPCTKWQPTVVVKNMLTPCWPKEQTVFKQHPSKLVLLSSLVNTQLHQNWNWQEKSNHITK